MRKPDSSLRNQTRAVLIDKLQLAIK